MLCCKHFWTGFLIRTFASSFENKNRRIFQLHSNKQSTLTPFIGLKIRPCLFQPPLLFPAKSQPVRGQQIEKKDFRPASPGNNNSFSRPKTYRKTPSPGNYRRSSQDRDLHRIGVRSLAAQVRVALSSEARRVRLSGPTFCSCCHREGHLKKDCKNCWINPTLTRLF